MKQNYSDTAVTVVDEARMKLMIEEMGMKGLRDFRFFSLSATPRDNALKLKDQLKRMLENKLLADSDNPDAYSIEKLAKLSHKELIAKAAALISEKDRNLSENLLLEKTGALSYYGAVYYLLNNLAREDLVPFVSADTKTALMEEATKNEKSLNSKLDEKNASLIADFGSLEAYFDSVINDASLENLEPVSVDRDSKITFAQAEKLRNKYALGPHLKRIRKVRGNISEFFAEVEQDRKVLDVLLGNVREG